MNKYEPTVLNYSPTIRNAIFLSLIFLALTACSSPSGQAAILTTPKVTIPQENPVSTATQNSIAETSPEVFDNPSPSKTPIPTAEVPRDFDGEEAYNFLLEQLEFGPRWPGSSGHTQVGDYVVEKMGELNWEVAEQIFLYQGIEGRNIIARNNVGLGPVIILGAHYDTRMRADKSSNSEDPVPGAVDGASGVAVLLELARTLNREKIDREIWLAFFDIEDQGSEGMPGFDWIVGSTVLANSLQISPEAMILVDMVGDADQQLFYEGNSDPELRALIWQIAADLGYQDSFIPEQKHTMIDDHLPFARLGIPAVDIIDFDYPYYHTVEDTADKASPDSLLRVGRTLETWLESLEE